VAEFRHLCLRRSREKGIAMHLFQVDSRDITEPKAARSAVSRLDQKARERAY